MEFHFKLYFLHLLLVFCTFFPYKLPTQTMAFIIQYISTSDSLICIFCISLLQILFHFQSVYMDDQKQQMNLNPDFFFSFFALCLFLSCFTALPPRASHSGAETQSFNIHPCETATVRCCQTTQNLQDAVTPGNG